jgi:hypothetical protein
VIRALSPHYIPAAQIVNLNAQRVQRILGTAHSTQQPIIRREASECHPPLELAQVAEHRLQVVFRCSGLLARQIVGHKMLEIE